MEPYEVAGNSNIKSWFLTNLAIMVKSLKKVEDNLDKKYEKINQDVLDRLSKIVDGKDGEDGKDGNQGPKGDRGEKGSPGIDGKDGKDGDSVVDARIDFDGSLVITMSTGKEINVGEVVPDDLRDKLKVFISNTTESSGITPGTLYVDNVNNFVGINAPTPTTPLDVTANALYSGGFMTNVYNTVSGIQSEAKLFINDGTIYQSYTYDALGTPANLDFIVEPSGVTIISSVGIIFSSPLVNIPTLTSNSFALTGPDFNVSTSNSINPANVNFTNTLGGGSKLTLSTAGASALSDAVIVFKNTTATTADWSVGCDHSDTKAFKISRFTTLGTNDALIIRSDTQRVGIGATYANITAPLTVGGVAAFAAGTAALPSIARSTDLDTGIWFPAVNEVGVSTNGSEKLRIISSGNVGIGESVPDYKLDVNGTFGFTPGTSVTPVDNGDVVFELTNNTTFTIRAKGSDGTTRSVALTLA
jgi:hypothetical protein